jgi:hypothetical protein
MDSPDLSDPTGTKSTDDGETDDRHVVTMSDRESPAVDDEDHP